MLFSIITPTTGSHLLTRLLRCLNEQDLAAQHRIEHFVVIDGPAFEGDSHRILSAVPPDGHIERLVMTLPLNTGASGYLGHKIYAAVSQLVRGDYVLFLDQDNLYTKNHIQSLADLAGDNAYEWMFTMRSILMPGDKERVACDDVCESLGHLSPVWNDPLCDNYLIDTNCFCIRRDILTPVSPIWNRVGTNSANDPDRMLTRFLLQNFHKYKCTGRHTVLYQTASRQNSVKVKFFLDGNKAMQKLYRSPRPWSKPILYLAHFDLRNTDVVLHRLYRSTLPLPCVAWHQWQLNICDRLTDKYLVKSAYRSPIPSGSPVLFHMCHPHELPQDIVGRKDLYRILTTIESPNTRHRQQWALPFLQEGFTHVITYWEPLLHKLPPSCVTYFPFVGRVDMSNVNDIRIVSVTDRVVQRPLTVALVLENRPFNLEFTIEGFGDVPLHALDYRRREIATALGKACHCHGPSWSDLSGVVTYHETRPRHLDEEFVTDLYAAHSFVLIIENVDAEGYVSEKLYDALVAGCIPLYHGNIGTRLQLPPEAYIDIKDMTPAEVADLVCNMPEAEVMERRRKIVEIRGQVLRRNGVEAYARVVEEVVDRAETWSHENRHKQAERV